MNEESPLTVWKKQVSNIPNCKVLCTGTKIWPGSVNPVHSNHLPEATWKGTDIEGGEGVDIVADLHNIHEIVGRDSFDAIFSPATLEHVQRPWVALRSMAQVLRPGGGLFIQTHQTFPLHGYPHDYFRFSVEALITLCSDAGLRTIGYAYENPCTITPPSEVTVWNHVAESYLNVCITAVKP